MLSAAVLIPLITAALLPLAPARPSRLPFALALSATTLSALALAITTARFDPARGRRLRAFHQAASSPSLPKVDG